MTYNEHTQQVKPIEFIYVANSLTLSRHWTGIIVVLLFVDWKGIPQEDVVATFAI